MTPKKFYRCLYKKWCKPFDYIHIYEGHFILYPEIIPQITKDKPQGLWFSYPNIDDSWTGFCLRGLIDWIDPDKCTIYRIDIHEDKIYYINTITELEYFHNHYNKKGFPEWNLLVQEGWSGVFFETMYSYLESENILHQEIMSWYKTWDCVSGCIWNMNAIKNTEILYKKI